MEGLIPYEIGMAMIVGSVAISAVALSSFVVFLCRDPFRRRRSDAPLCAVADIPTAADVEELLRSLTPEDIAAAEKFAADVRRADGTPES